MKIRAQRLLGRSSLWFRSAALVKHFPSSGFLLRPPFPSLLDTWRLSAQHSGGCSADVWPFVFLGHSIRRWARSASCSSTSRATWRPSSGTTGRDMPGSRGRSSWALKATLKRGGFSDPTFILASLALGVSSQEKVRVTAPESAAVIGRDLPEGDGVHVLRVQALRPPGGGGDARGGRIWAGGAGESATQGSF